MKPDAYAGHAWAHITIPGNLYNKCSAFASFTLFELFRILQLSTLGALI